MNHQPWRDRLEAELIRRGVPAKFRRRLLAEASDHADDLTEEGEMSCATMEARLGRPDEVAATAADQYRRATWTRRHPLLVFGLLPVPLFVLTVVVLGVVMPFAFAGIGWLTVPDLGSPTARGLVVTSAYAVAWALKFVPFAFMTWFFTRRFVRSGVHWGWYAAALTQVLFLAGTFFSTIRYSDVPGDSSLALGFSWMPSPTADGGTTAWSPLGWSQPFQLLVPAGLAWVLVKLARRREAALIAA